MGYNLMNSNYTGLTLKVCALSIARHYILQGNLQKFSVK